VADVDRDRVLHPRRPLAAGRMSVASAWLLGVLMSSGALLAGALIGYRGLCMVGIVLSLILIYNFVTKSLPWLGSLTMALVRASNALFCLLILGEVYFDRMMLTLLQWLGLAELQVGVLEPRYPLLLGAYIFGLTLISELERRRGRRWELLLGGVLVLGVIVTCLSFAVDAAWLHELYRGGRFPSLIGAVLLIAAITIALLWRIGAPYVRAVREGKRKLVGPVVAAGLGGMLLFDALVASIFFPILGLVILLLFIPYRMATALIRMD